MNVYPTKIGIIIQARTGSTRLPNKMTKPFYKNESVMSLLLDRLTKILGKENIIVATTTNTSDDEIVKICDNLNVNSFRGSESDVLGRFIDAAEINQFEKIIRICGDNLFLDIEALKYLIMQFRQNDFIDYISYQSSDGIPSIKTHYGFWAEGVTINALKKVATITNDNIYHEHVTNYIYTHTNYFKCDFIKIDPKIELHKNLRLTLDTQTDFEVQQLIYDFLMRKGWEINPYNILKFLEDNENLYDLMHASIIENSK